MNSIREKVVVEWVVKRSRFIAHLMPVHNLEDIQGQLDRLRKAHPDAAHHCFAYILGMHSEVQKADDDGEPSQTAGQPILEVLRKHTLSSVLCVVVRYYGGIKLGAGGLIRAYAKSTALALSNARITIPSTLLTATIDASFDVGGKLERFLREHATVTDVRYGNDITFFLEILETDFEHFQSLVRDRAAGRARLTVTGAKTVYH